MEINQFLISLITTIVSITTASVINYYVMRRIMRVDLQKMLLNRIFGGEEIKGVQKLISRLNDALDSKDVAEVKKELMRILKEL